MLRNLLIAALSTACLIAPAHVHATKFETVQDLLRTCSSNADLDVGKCAGYIAGILDTINVCPPENATYGQMAAVFTAWAQRNPQKWNEGRLYAIEAFQEAWPCK
jgi:hypothetical protein